MKKNLQLKEKVSEGYVSFVSVRNGRSVGGYNAAEWVKMTNLEWKRVAAEGFG